MEKQKVPAQSRKIRLAQSNESDMFRLSHIIPFFVCFLLWNSIILGQEAPDCCELFQEAGVLDFEMEELSNHTYQFTYSTNRIYAEHLPSLILNGTSDQEEISLSAYWPGEIKDVCKGIPFSGKLVQLEDTGGVSVADGCEPLEFPEQAEGQIVVLSSVNACTYAQQALNAQNAGAIGLIIYTNSPIQSTVDFSGIDIPVIIVSEQVYLNQLAGDAIEAVIAYTISSPGLDLCQCVNKIIETEWVFGDGSTAIGNNITHIFPSQSDCSTDDMYDVTLNITVLERVGDNTTCSETKQLVIPASGLLNDYEIVADPLDCGLISFSYNKVNPNLPDLADPQWTFGDGHLGIGDAPSHLYNANGTYTVILTDGGRPNACPIAITVTIDGLPITNFISTIDCSLEAAFTISDYDEAANYLWDFAGDSQIANEESLNFTFSDIGTKVVKLTKVDENGCSTTTSKTIDVGGPDAQFSIISPICAGAYLSVADVSPGVGDYQWEFRAEGESSWLPISTGVFPIYAIAEAGEHEIRLTVDDANCTAAEHIETIKVEPYPTATFNAIIDACTGEIELNVPAASLGQAYTLDFGDGTVESGTSLEANYSHRYDDTGVHVIRLTTTNEAGCSDYHIEHIVIDNPPTLQLYTPSETLCYNGQVNLQAIVSDAPGVVTYSWRKNGNPIDHQGAILSIEQGGEYQVRVSFDTGCSTVLTENIAIAEFSEITATATVLSAASCVGINDGSLQLDNLPSSPYHINNGPEQTSSSQVLENLEAGTHYIRIAYAELLTCYTILTVHIPDNGPQLSTSSTPSKCNQDTGVAAVNVTNGAAPYNYVWSNVLSPAIPIPNTAPYNELDNLAPGKYRVEVTDNNGCTASTEIEVKEVIVNLVLADAPIATCASGEIPVTVNVNYNIGNTTSGVYFWYKSNNNGGWSLMGGPPSRQRSLAPGFYKATYSDAFGCGDELEFVVAELDDLSVSLQIDQPNCNNGAGSIKAIVNGGTGNYNFNWSNSTANTSQITNVPIGDFSLTVTDVPGCSISTIGTVEAQSTDTMQFVSADIAGCDLRVTIAGGVGPYHYSWYVEEEITNYHYVIQPSTSDNLPPDTLQVVELGTEVAWHWVHSHTGAATTTTRAEGFTGGDYQLQVTDALGCRLNHAPIHLEIEEATVLPFSFVWSSVETQDTPKVVDPIIRENMAEASNALFNAMDDCVLSQKETLAAYFQNNCLNLDSLRDRFTLAYEQVTHHYTLYYYDRAGQLTQTVPPQGVEVFDEVAIQGVKDFRTDRSGSADVPAHRMRTQYYYNSLGQLVQQETPDGGTTRFIYDDLNRLRLSQNAKQAENNAYSYSKYDELGRLVEVGESTSTGPDFSDPAAAANYELIADPNFPATNNSYISRTTYSTPALVDYYGQNQRYLQNRVSYVWSDEDGNLSTLDDRYFIYYSYDPHGNVEWMIQDDPMLGKNYVAYNYDLISGNVLEVKYNEGRKDKFFHRYYYDPENRIDSVQTSHEGLIWDTDARYAYNEHGPLKRTLIGEHHVQGLDYVYSIHGWLKSINTPHLSTTTDPSQDGNGITSLSDTPQDRFGMTLGYYEGDFARTGSFLHGPNLLYQSSNADARDLYNGNISHWTNSQITEEVNTFGGIAVEAARAGVYRYDVLNRIKQSENAFASSAENIDSWGSNTNQFKTTYAYGANGNITELSRRQGTGAIMDKLEYQYDEGLAEIPLQNNRLSKVKDQASFREDGRGDLEKTHTYEYDPIGNLIKDVGKERLDLGEGYKLYDVTLIMDWHVNGKIKSVGKVISRGAFTRTDHIYFQYSPNGDRIRKVFHEDNDNDNIPQETEITTTFYIRDAQGNILSIYERKNEAVDDGYEAVFTLIEQAIYGSERLGLSKRQVEMARVPYVEGEEIALDLPADGILERAEYQNWITSSNRSILDNTICEGRITQVNFDATNNNQYSSDSDLAQFVGVAGNGLAVAENLAGELQFYVVLAENYLGQQDACLVFDREGHLMQGNELITEAYPQAKPIIVQYPGTDTYAVVTLNASGQPEYHTIDMSAVGYGTAATPMGIIVSAHQTIDATPDANYGWHFAGYEDHINGESIIYHTRYEPSLIDSEQGTTTIMAYLFGRIPNTPPQPGILHAVDGYGSTEEGELQLSANGQELSWYQHDLNVSAFAHRTFKLHLLPLASDHISLLGTPLVFNGSSAGNYGEGNLELAGQDLYYSQRGVYLEHGSDKNILKLERSSGDRLATNIDTEDYLYHEIKRGVDGQFYIPKKNDPADKVLTYNGSLGNESLHHPMVQPDTAFLVSSLPTQVYKISQTTLPDSGAVHIVGQKQYELKDHLGNVRVLVGDGKLGQLNAESDLTALAANVQGKWDYYPFGMGMKELSFEGGGFRFGFQGQEEDHEVKGDNNLIAYKYRGHNSRIGRFVQVDPVIKEYPWYSSYQFAGNKVIQFVELEGLEEGYYKQDGIYVSPSDHTHNNNPDYLNPSPLEKEFALQSLEERKNLIVLVQPEFKVDRTPNFIREQQRQAEQQAEFRAKLYTTQGPLVAGGPNYGTGLAYDPTFQFVTLEVATGGVVNGISGLRIGTALLNTAKSTGLAAKGSTTTVGRWMSKTEAAVMRNGSPAAVGAGGKTSVTVGGSNVWGSAPKGSVYVEFSVPTNSLVPGGGKGIYSILGPNASKSQLFQLQKLGGQVSPSIQNISPILKVK